MCAVKSQLSRFFFVNLYILMSNIEMWASCVFVVFRASVNQETLALHLTIFRQFNISTQLKLNNVFKIYTPLFQYTVKCSFNKS